MNRMKIRSLKVVNFLPFYGEQILERCCSSSNITIFFGENTKGKNQHSKRVQVGSLRGC